MICEKKVGATLSTSINRVVSILRRDNRKLLWQVKILKRKKV